MSSSSEQSPPAEIKYDRGTGARVPPGQRPLRPLEWAVLTHLAVFVVGTTWAFGGAAEWLRPVLAWWGSLGLLLTLTAVQDRSAWRDGWMKPLVWLAPLVVFNALVFVSLLHPSLREVKFDTEILLAKGEGSPWIPSSTRIGDALPGLWLFDAIWISCFNLALVVRQRRAIRGLLIIVASNTLALAIFGTVQKLARAEGLFFNAVPSPQKYFFSTFVYHNHWGAFTVLTTAVCLALAWHYARRHQSRDVYHSPVFGGLVVVLLLAATVPLSGSRSSTLLTALLLGGAFAHWTLRLVRKRRRFKESVLLPITGALGAIALGLAGVAYVARDTIEVRVALTRTQVGDMRAAGSVGSRVALYHDTWTMAAARPLFGWGMGSYPQVFRFFNTQYAPDIKTTRFYRDAHSDWLQSLAEHGFVGTALLALGGVVPLLRLRRRHLASPLPTYLLAGCALVLLYAWVEFPFGNVAVVLVWWLSFFCAVHYARLYDREAPAPVKSGSASG
jgi:O-antigen ligase